MAARWIEPLGQALRAAVAYRSFALRPAAWADEDWLFALHRDAMREYVDRTWGWDEAWQRNHFAGDYAPVRNAVILRTEPGTDAIGRISLSLHWRKVFLRDIELVATERNQGLGAALLAAWIRGRHRRRRAPHDARPLAANAPARAARNDADRSARAYASTRCNHAPTAVISSMHTECSIRYVCHSTA
jgi:hypothetical protein